MRQQLLELLRLNDEGSSSSKAQTHPLPRKHGSPFCLAVATSLRVKGTEAAARHLPLHNGCDKAFLEHSHRKIKCCGMQR